MRISDWSSDVCSSDLLSVRISHRRRRRYLDQPDERRPGRRDLDAPICEDAVGGSFRGCRGDLPCPWRPPALGQASHADPRRRRCTLSDGRALSRSEEHTSELQSLMRISYAVFCLKKNKYKQTH